MTETERKMAELGAAAYFEYLEMCFEDEGSAPGHRSYLGSTLPDDAPPRPSKTADWVDGNWVDAFADNNNNNIYTKTLDYDY